VRATSATNPTIPHFISLIIHVKSKTYEAAHDDIFPIFLELHLLRPNILGSLTLCPFDLRSSNSPPFTESECSLPRSPDPASCPYPDQGQSSPHPHPSHLRSILILSYHIRLGIFPSDFPIKTLYASPLSFIRLTSDLSTLNGIRSQKKQRSVPSGFRSEQSTTLRRTISDWQVISDVY